MADLAVALDLPRAADALRLVDRLGEAVRWYKVGPVLYISDGPALVRELLARSRRVFVDLKWHDIPHTVQGAVAAAASLGVHLATVHLSGGRAMLEAAVAAKGGGEAALRLVGVGVLTSLDADAYAAVVGRPVLEVAAEQERLARAALGAGLDGFVCAAAEVPRLRALAGAQALLVTPGIRGAGAPTGDQRRTASPGEAVRAGADLLVVGRPVTAAGDPADAVRWIREEMAA